MRYLRLERRRPAVAFEGPMKAVSQSLRVASSDCWANTSEPVIKDNRTTVSITFIISPPLALHDERRPVVRRFPLLRSQHLDLRGAQRSRWRLFVLQHSHIKVLHQSGGRFVVNVP